ncbi:2-polyprenyl-6-methoxyphenol hydroxylase-like FAD-dependent oxidoreductase [Mycobacterium sp. BK086]|uniref:FAD-binding domain n=1 Tax=Mycobacterium sp. BK086 TaxID=2512165 RepID=UPI00105C4D9A|nr:FAD-binding domain [Mycobacterium sp. BK086]TDO07224.1 2-polyprenyl-6-methoxyphenol hydroxylase-like FAD-dependent oxidoreductase [Mycobacterium sp. BK086]
MKIAISGAGVAGPTLAYWLHRTGHQPTLIERAPEFRTGGYVIDFWGVGFTVAQRMGIEAAVRARGYQVQSIRAARADGRTRASLGVDPFRRAVGDRFTSIPRGDLAETIYATIEDDVEAIFGDSITAVEEHSDGVGISFERAKSREFDLVIGADGLHSNLRRLTFGNDEAAEHYLGCVVAACVVDGYRPRDDLVYVTYPQPGRSIGRFTLRDDRTMFLFLIRCPEPYASSETARQKALVRSHFADATGECADILAALDDADDFYFDVVSQIRLDRWSRGRTALIGDAAACVSLMAGEGTGLAMTEAYVLAGELQRARGDHRTAFDTYESRLRAFVRGKQGSAEKFLPIFATQTALGLWIRDVVMTVLDALPRADLIIGRDLRDDFELPDYSM